MSQFPTILARLRDRAAAAMLASVTGRRRFLAEEDRALTRLAPDVAAAGSEPPSWSIGVIAR